MHVLDISEEFVNAVLKENPTLSKSMTMVLSNAAPALCSSPLLRSQANQDNELRNHFAHLIFTRLIRPLLVNYAFMQIEEHDAKKEYSKTPFSRKYE